MAWRLAFPKLVYGNTIFNFLFIYFQGTPSGVQNLSFQKRNGIYAPCSGSTYFNHWTTRESPWKTLLMGCKIQTSFRDSLKNQWLDLALQHSLEKLSKHMDAPIHTFTCILLPLLVRMDKPQYKSRHFFKYDISIWSLIVVVKSTFTCSQLFPEVGAFFSFSTFFL